MGRGKFITFEGGEGAGKSTQVALLVKSFQESGVNVAATREPGGSPGAEAIRRLLLDSNGEWDGVTDTLLFTAARRDNVTKVIKPALADGTWVVSDRFFDSTIAYQGYGHDVPVGDIELLQHIALGDFEPDLTIVLDVPVDIGFARIAERGGTDRFEKLDRAFHERLRLGYWSITHRHPHRCVLIDAAREADGVQQDIFDVVSKRFIKQGEPA